MICNTNLLKIIIYDYSFSSKTFGCRKCTFFDM